MRDFVYIFIFIGCLSLEAQVFTPLDSLLVGVDNLYSQKMEASTLEFNQTNKYKALNYLPSIGYDFFNHRPILTYNISSLAGYLNNKQALEFKRQSIEKNIIIDLDQVQKTITTHYLQLNSLFYAYGIEYEIFNLNNELYSLSIKKYENNEIPLEVFIQKKIDIKEQEKKLYSMRDRIFQSIVTLENLTNYEINYEIKSITAAIDISLP